MSSAFLLLLILIVHHALLSRSPPQTKRNWIDGNDYQDYELLSSEHLPFDVPNFDLLVQRDYIVSTYRQWVDGAEEYPEEDDKLQEIYGACLGTCALQNWS